MNPEILTVCNHLVGGTVNAVYQGIIVTGLIGLGLRLCRRTNAATRHATWFSGLLVVALLFPAHWLLDSSPSLSAAGRKSEAAGLAGNGPIPTQKERHEPLAGERTKAPNTSEPVASVLSETATTKRQPMALNLSEDPPAPEDRLYSNGSPVSTVRRSSDPAEVSRQADVSSSVGKRAASTSGTHLTRMRQVREPLVRPTLIKRLQGLAAPSSGSLVWVSAAPWNLSVGLLALWSAVAGCRLWLLVVGLVRLRKLKRESSEPATELRQLFEGLVAETGIHRPVALRLSDACRSPMALGFLHPAIVLPAKHSHDANPASVRHVMHHELAHIKRRDDWANLIQQAMGALLFFHPAVWWISKRTSLDREIACDDAVLQHCARPRSYALTLANLALRMNKDTPMLATGVSTRRHQLKERINMILNTQRNTSPSLVKTRMGVLTTSALLASALALYAAPRLILAQTASPANSRDAGGSNATVTNPASAVQEARPGAKPKPAPVASVSASVSSSMPSGIDPGPKPKPGVTQATQRGESALSSSSAVNVPAATSLESALPAAPAAPMPPRQVPSVSVAVPRSRASIEERLDRLEKLVHSLIEHRNANQSINLRLNDNLRNALGDRAEIKDALGGRAEIKVQIQRQAERAAEQAKRAAEQATRAAEIYQRSLDGFMQQNVQHFKESADIFKKEHAVALEKSLKAMKDQTAQLKRQGLQKQIEALQQARDELGRKLGDLNRQIQQLKLEQSGLKGRTSGAPNKPEENAAAAGHTPRD